MQPQEIRQLLTTCGITNAIMAEALDIRPVSVSQVINRRMTSARTARAIAKAINRDFHEVFPEYAKRRPICNPKPAEAKKRVADLKKIIA